MGGKHWHAKKKKKGKKKKMGEKEENVVDGQVGEGRKD